MLCCLLLALVLGCRDEVPSVGERGSLGTEIGMSAQAERLRQALERDYYSSELRSGGLDTLSVMIDFQGLKPLWDKACSFSIDGEYEVLRVPISVEASWSRVATGMTEEESERYPNANKTYLVRVEDERYPEGRNYLMHLIPSVRFLQTGEALDVEDALIPKGFDGEIELYTLQRRLLSREFFDQGRRYVTFRYLEQVSGLRKAGDPECMTFKEYYTETSNEVAINDLDLPGATPLDGVVVVGRYKLRERCPDLPAYNVSYPPDHNQDSGGGIAGAAPGSSSPPPPAPSQDEEVSKRLVPRDSVVVVQLDTVSKERFEERLKEAFNEMLQDCFYAALVEALHEASAEEGGHILSRAILTNDRGSIGTASYNTKREITFYALDFVRPSTMAHEFIHAYQYSCHGLTRMGELKGMLEYEVALVQDVLRYLDATERSKTQEVVGDPYWEIGRGWTPVPDSIANEKGDEERDAYLDWLGRLTKKGTVYPESIDDKEFYQYSEVFGRRSRAYSPMGYRYGEGVGYEPKTFRKMFEIRRNYNKCKK